MRTFCLSFVIFCAAFFKLFQNILRLCQYGVDLVVKVFDHDLGLEIHLIIVFGSASVFFFLPVLTHHDKRSLNRRDA